MREKLNHRWFKNNKTRHLVLSLTFLLISCEEQASDGDSNELDSTNDLIFNDTDLEDGLYKLAPWIKNQKMIDEKPTIYVCQDFSCRKPTTRVAAALRYLEE